MHLRQAGQESQGGLGSLIMIHALWVQSVAAPARMGIVEGQPEIITPEEPQKCSLGFLEPGSLACGPVHFQAG